MGLSRTTLFELCARKKIRSVVIKKKAYAVRGIRLMYLPSLQEYLFEQSVGGNDQTKGNL